MEVASSIKKCAFFNLHRTRGITDNRGAALALANYIDPLNQQYPFVISKLGNLIELSDCPLTPHNLNKTSHTESCRLRHA